MAIRRRSARVTRRRRAARRAAVTPRAPKRKVTRKARKAVTPRAPKRKATRKARRAATPKAPKRRRATRRATRRAARKAVTPRAPKRKTTRRTARKAKRVTRRKAAKKPRKPKTIIGSMRRVFAGTADKTSGGLTKKDLMMNKRGKVVSKKANKSGAKQFKKSGLGKWVAACQKARAELGLVGFVACKKGTAYYNLAKKHFAN